MTIAQQFVFRTALSSEENVTTPAAGPNTSDATRSAVGDIDHRAPVIEHFLAPPDPGDDLLGGVSACHDS